jgi:IS5 family transposase
MISQSNPLTPHLFDPWSYLGPKRRRQLERSWAGAFQREVLPRLPVAELAATYRADFGRPGKSLHTALGVLVLQQMLDLTDEETVEQLAFHEMWHYALGIADTSDAATYMSLRTLWGLRQKAVALGLGERLFAAVTDALAAALGVAGGKQRLDSVRVQSDMARLGRVRLLARVIRGFLGRLRRQDEARWAEVPAAVRARHAGTSGDGVFGRVKPSASEATLRELAEELLALYDRFAGDEAVAGLRSFRLLGRVLQEQCRVEETAGGRRVSVREAREVPPDSLQNPSDPDAAYSGHKGQGYLVQVMETYGQDGAAPELITHVAVAPADAPDAAAVQPALADVAARDLTPATLLADTAYGGDDNVQAAAGSGVTLTAPVAGQPERTALRLADFAADEAGRVTACPLGQAPASVRPQGERITALFPAAVCAGCPRRPDCPVKRGKSHYRLVYTLSARRASQRRAREETAEFREAYRFRSGIEGTISQLDRRTGFKRLRVRGLVRMRFCLYLKALGLNIRRVAAALAGNRRPNGPGNRPPAPDRAANGTPASVLALLACAWNMIFKEPGDIVTTGNILAIRRTPGQTGSIAWLPAAYPLAG